ncbi:pectinesterase inhibitor 9 [Mercurialis annua]|uniref:pectinesterase inhibitor 9 n=1 Tax=Mercurialis annua TaxID=3986 RepID=UPI00215E9C3F|nr:pectinesterase inhibitor 9 [Mercurialis annua]
MANLRLSLFLTLLPLLCISGTAQPTSVKRSRSRSPSYIESSCRATRYPALCLQYLSTLPNSTIQNPHQLAQAALTVSLYRARYTRSYMLKITKQLRLTKAKEYQAVKDCLDQINDSVQQLGQSIRELRRLGSQEETAVDAVWRLSNVESWTSAALSDASFCLNEFPGRRMSKLKATIKGKVLNVAQATSNALALFHRFAVRYRAAAKKLP